MYDAWGNFVYADRSFLERRIEGFESQCLTFPQVTDIMWAPFAGFLLQCSGRKCSKRPRGATLSRCMEMLHSRYLFGSWLVSSLGALEEFLPFTDILPTATLAWELWLPGFVPWLRMLHYCLCTAEAICHLEWLGFLRVLLGVQRHSSHGPLASDHSHDD